MDIRRKNRPEQATAKVLSVSAIKVNAPEPKNLAAQSQIQPREMAMTLIRNVAGTAFVVAEFRAEGNLKENPLYHDPVVHVFLDEELKRAADRIFASFPPIKTNVWVRTRYLDNRLDARLQSGFRQVVILAAELDTRAQRKAKSGVAYFEIDDGATLAFKRERLHEKGIEPGVAYIPGDYVADGLVELLSRNGFDFLMPTHFIWEGNTMYLSADAVARVLEAIAQNLRRFSISFDYMAPEVIANETGNPEITAVVERFAAMGAPWTYGISDVESLGKAIGARVSDRFTLADLHRLYWPDKTPELATVRLLYALHARDGVKPRSEAAAQIGCVAAPMRQRVGTRGLARLRLGPSRARRHSPAPLRP